jgi:hypothetical protein
VRKPYPWLCTSSIPVLQCGNVKNWQGFVSVLGGHLTDCNNLVGFSVCIKLETIYIYIYIIIMILLFFNFFFPSDTW